MCLLITVLAAAVSTLVWYLSEKSEKLRLSKLALMYWGASIMWFVDAVFEYAQVGTEIFNPSFSDMLNDAFLGICAVALGLLIWLAILIFHDNCINKPCLYHLLHLYEARTVKSSPRNAVVHKVLDVVVAFPTSVVL